ncbi:hypothetical protein [Bradyrhizobium japonicum]|uniref:hypothetical protein n=1 Tax=Bradyrhizobium japonicum TaxID=375 RepID=UPI001AEBC06A|nr:hypothetical protein [Bradyrhizobium japonicum]
MNITIRDMGGQRSTIVSAAAGLIRATLSDVRLINAANGVGVGGGAAVLSNSVVSSNSVAGIAISGGGINIDAMRISFNAIGIKQERSTRPTMTVRSIPLACRARSLVFEQSLLG